MRWGGQRNPGLDFLEMQLLAYSTDPFKYMPVRPGDALLERGKKRGVLAQCKEEISPSGVVASSASASHMGHYY